jgi:glyoxylase-like metal-dependent hydrolase (beta-lactamase superfamily II)
MWDVWALRAGSSKVDQSMLTYLEGAGREVSIPHVMLLLKGPWNVLVDTSFGSPAQIAEHYPQELRRPGDELPEPLLAEIGLAVGDIDLIIHTHLHYDHVGNNHLFPHATKLAQTQEVTYAEAPGTPIMGREYFTPACGFPAQFNARELTTVEGDHTVADGLDIISLEGHTPGSQGIVVTTSDGPLCYAGDLVMVSENMDPMTPVGLHVDLEACERSRQKVASLHARVVPSHDMRLFDSGPVRRLADEW